MKEVFPTKEFFGTNLMSIIDKDLRKMLLSSKEEEWNSSYQSIADKIQSDPAKMAKLDKIKGNPSYYAGYYLKRICGHLEMNGSVPAEQNHASVVAHLGKGAMWDIWEQLKHLCLLVNTQRFLNWYQKNTI